MGMECEFCGSAKAEFFASTQFGERHLCAQCLSDQDNPDKGESSDREDYRKAARPISDSAIYPVPLFLDRARIGYMQLRAAQANGLPVRRFAGIEWIHGADFIQYIGRVSDEPAQQAPKPF